MLLYLGLLEHCTGSYSYLEVSGSGLTSERSKVRVWWLG